MKKSIFAVLTAAAVVFTACNKEDSNPSTGETGNVFVQVTTPEASPETRGEASRLSTEPISVGEGYLFFTESNGVINHYVAIKSTPGVGDVDLAQLTGAGATVPNVPSSTRKAYILSVLPTGFTLPTITPNVTNITTVQALTADVDDLHDASNGVANVPLWGEGSVAYNAAQTDLVTDIRVEAIGSRLQVVKFTGTNDIKSYDIDGIFVNNYFKTMPFSMTLAPAAIVDNQSNEAKYAAAVYDAADAHYLYDETGSALGQFNNSTLETTPTTGAVWAYNVFPTAGMTGGADETTIPHIVVRLKNVVYYNGSTDVPVAGPLFMTVHGMSKGSPSTPVTELENGKIYTFEDIPFEYDDLTTTPEVKTINAIVTITEVAWAEEIVTPEL